MLVSFMYWSGLELDFFEEIACYNPSYLLQILFNGKVL